MALRFRYSNTDETSKDEKLQQGRGVASSHKRNARGRKHQGCGPHFVRRRWPSHTQCTKLEAPEGKTSYRRTSRNPAKFAEPGISGCLADNSIRGPAGDSFFSVGVSGWSRWIQTGPPQGLGRLQWVDATAGGGDYRVRKPACSGRMPKEIRPILFGGSLIALNKESGGLRPIAIGYVWRRLTAKVCKQIRHHQAVSLLCTTSTGHRNSGGLRSSSPRNETLRERHVPRPGVGKA